MSELKYKYACLKDGTPIHISDADKSQEYFLYSNERIKLILKHGKKNQKHFAAKADYLYVDGKKVKFNLINESAEHYNFKMKILKDSYFFYNNYKILIKNAKIELRILNTLYRADVFGELLCGTPCIIEVIKTSKVSEVKKEFINKNQILTFEIIIDKDGNQIIEQSNCYGNAELERLTNEITESKKEFESEARKLYIQYENKAWSINNRVETAIQNAGGSICDIQREYSKKRDDCESKFRNFENKCRSDTEWLERIRRNIESTETQITETMGEISNIENKIRTNY